MPGIGDYIHHTKNGYRDYGITRDIKEENPTIGFKFSEIRYPINTPATMNKTKLNELARFITAVMNPSDDNIELLTAKDQKDLIEACNQALLEKMIEDVRGTAENKKKDIYGVMNKIIEEQRRGTYNFLDYKNDVIRKQIKNSQAAQITDTFWNKKTEVYSISAYKNLCNMLKSIDKSIKGIRRRNLASAGELNLLESMRDKFQERLDSVTKLVEKKDLPQSRKEKLKGIRNEARFKVISSKDKKSYNLYKQMHKLYNRIIYNSTVQLYQGPLGERAASLGAALLLDYYFKQSYTTARDSLIESALSEGENGHIVGDVTTQTVIKLENFDQKIVDEIRSGGPGKIKKASGKILTPSKDGKILYYFGDTQGKVDVTYNFNTTTDLQPPLNFSVKNVNSDSEIHLVSGTSLLFLLQDIPADYVNHYLNIVGTQPPNRDNSGKTYYSQFKDEFTSGDPVQAIKAAIFQKALVGSKVKGEQANYFIAIIKGKVYVKTTNAIVDSIVRNKLQGVHFKLGYRKTTGSSVDLSDFRQYNTLASSPETRIGRYLAKLAATNITVSINQQSIINP